jgi:hypothetical protein
MNLSQMKLHVYGTYEDWPDRLWNDQRQHFFSISVVLAWIPSWYVVKWISTWWCGFLECSIYLIIALFFFGPKGAQRNGNYTISSSPMKISLTHPRVMPVYYEKKNISTSQKKFSTKSIKVFNCKWVFLLF